LTTALLELSTLDTESSLRPSSVDLFSSFLSRLVSAGAGGADSNLLSSAERVDPVGIKPVGPVWMTLIGALEVEPSEVFEPMELAEPPDNSINLKLAAQF
jgi:hypothetical protein